MAVSEDDGVGLQIVSGPSGDPTPRKRRSRKPLLIGSSVLLVLLIMMIGGVGYYGYSLTRGASQMQREQLMPTTDAGNSGQNGQTGSAPDGATGLPAISQAPGSLNFVLIGSDTRNPGSDRGRSDALMVAHIPANRSKVYLISFPRDLWVDVPGHGKAKINAAYAYGGAPLTVQTLEQLTRTKMNHAAIVNFESFAGLTSAVGGVEVFNASSFSNSGYSFEPGIIHIEGEQALAFVRERKQLGSGDLDRAAHQREVVMALIEKMSSPEIVANPIRMTQVINQASRTVKVDQELTTQKMTEIALSMKVRNNKDIESFQAPMTGFSTSEDGQAIDVVDEKQMTELGNALRNDTLDDYRTKFPLSCTGPKC